MTENFDIDLNQFAQKSEVKNFSEISPNFVGS